MSATEAAEHQAGDVMNLGHGRYISRAQHQAGSRAVATAGSMTKGQQGSIGYLLAGSDDAIKDARKILKEGDRVGDDMDISDEMRNVWELAAAADTLGGVRGKRGSILGSKTLEGFMGDDEASVAFRTQLSTRFSKDQRLVGGGYIGRREMDGLGTISSQREEFSGKMDQVLSRMGIGTGFLGMGKGAQLREDLVGDENTRGAFAKYLKAYNSGDPEAIAAAVGEFDKLGDSGDALKELANRAKSDRGTQLALKSMGGNALEYLEKLGYSEHRERERSKTVGKIDELYGSDELGDLYRDELIDLSKTNELGAYQGKIQGFTKKLLGGGISGEEQKLLDKVFGASGSSLGTAFGTLTGGKGETLEKQISALGLDLKAKDLEGMDESAPVAKVIDALAKKGLLDPAAFSGSGSSTDVGDTRKNYVEANTRFIAAVDRFVTNLRVKVKMTKPVFTDPEDE